MKRVRLIWSLACFAAIAASPAGFSAGALAAAEAPAQTGPSGANIWSSSYKVRLDVLPDGSLDVVELVTLNVGAKSMSWFERVIPSRRTDGLTNVVALMDGESVPVLIEQNRDLKIRWEFSPVANATRRFEIRYRALRVLAREIDGPRLLWTALPRRHTYPIESAEISVFAPTGSIANSVTTPGGELLPDRPGIVVGAKSLARDKAVVVDITFAPNSIKPAEPRWFVEQQEQEKMLPAWLAAGASLLAVGIGILVMMFARLPKTKAADDGAFVSPAPEGSAPPGLVTLLLSRGQQNVGVLAAFFRLVRDGHLIVKKRGESSRWRGGAFDVTPSGAPGTGAAIAPHESWILDAVHEQGPTPDMRRLMTRLSRRQRAFRAAVTAEAAERGWIDGERQRARGGLFLTGLVLVFSGLVGSFAVLLLANRLGPAPVILPAVILLVGLVYIVVASAMSMLSEAGVNEAARWQARVAEVKNIIKDGVSGQSPKDFERWFPLAIGAGIGGKWLKAFEAQLAADGADLGWLKAMGSPADAASSLVLMMAVSGASHSGGVGGGGAGGGGSSGAG